MQINLAAAAIAALAVCGAVPRAAAQSVNCTLAATPLQFGHYLGNANAALDVTATITITCSVAVGTATMGYSLAPVDNAMPARAMAGPAAPALAYQLYTDASETIAWSDATPLAGSITVISGTPSVRTITIYGRIFSEQVNVPEGAYMAAIPIQLTYDPAG